MAVPWLQIVNLMPTILDVSRELLKRARRTAPDADFQAIPADAPTDRYEARIRALEENERRQAELVTTMADQLSQLTLAASSLHRMTRWLIASQLVTLLLAVIALGVALR